MISKVEQDLRRSKLQMALSISSLGMNTPSDQAMKLYESYVRGEKKLEEIEVEIDNLYQKTEGE